MSDDDFEYFESSKKPRVINVRAIGAAGLTAIVVLTVVMAYVVYSQFRIDVPAKHIAVLTLKTGEDLENFVQNAFDQAGALMGAAAD